jgi:hypothetical protein
MLKSEIAKSRFLYVWVKKLNLIFRKINLSPARRKKMTMAIINSALTKKENRTDGGFPLNVKRRPN